MHIFLVGLLCHTLILLATSDSQICNITDYGAVGDNRTLNTAAIVSAIADCHRRHPFGSTVFIPSGIFITGSFNLTSNMTLRLGVNATLAGSTKEHDYPLTTNRPSYCVCRDIGSSNRSSGLCRHQALIGGSNISNIALEGSGTGTSIIDGRGYIWWAKRPPFAPSLGYKYGRPMLFEPMFCSQLRVVNITLKDSPFWTCAPYACSGIYIADTTILAPDWYKLPDRPPSGNTDGIDLDSCTNVIVERVYVSVGDDALAIKSGMDWCGRQAHMTSENIVIRNSTFVTHCLALGSEMSGDINNVTVDNCVFGNTSTTPLDGAGIRIKSHMTRGGVMKNLRFTNLRMLHVGQAIIITLGNEPFINESATPRIHHALFENITVEATQGCAGSMISQRDQISNITIHNVSVLSQGSCKKKSGWNCAGVIGTISSAVLPPLPPSCLSS